MSFDPYEILGVARDVEAKDLKDAFKKRSKETHPDVNGTGDDTEFKIVKQAYDLLSNEEERAFFDATGLMRNVSEQQLRTQMFQTLKASFDDTIKKCFDEGVRITNFGILEHMKKSIQHGLDTIGEAIDAITSQIDQLVEMRKAITRDDDEENLFSMRMGEMVDEREKTLLEHVNAHKVVEMTLAEVSKYTSTTEMMMAMERERADMELAARFWGATPQSHRNPWNTWSGTHG